MQVTYIDSKEINSDLGVVNAARVSLGKKSSWFVDSNSRKSLKEEDKRLISYLAKHNHWTPFAHPRAYFDIEWRSKEDALNFFMNYNQGGFSSLSYEDSSLYSVIKGSLIGWINNLKYLPQNTSEYIHENLYMLTPESTSALHHKEVPLFAYNTSVISLNEDYVKYYYPNLYTVTLLFKVPIAIARQVRTSQVGFAYSDYYVEGEAFVYNEISRRYVNDEPEFYNVHKWRVRKGKSIKQGSTGVANEELEESMYLYSHELYKEADTMYRKGVENNIAPEQLRFLLPQSMYTEFYMTGTLKRWVQWLELRLKPEVQEETRAVASQVYAELCKAAGSYMESRGLEVST